MEWSELSPLKKLLGSRKFLLLILDTVVSVVLWIASSYFPEAQEAVKFMIMALQPVIIAVIVAIAWEDVAYANSK